MLEVASTASAPSPLHRAVQHAQTSCIKCGFCLPKCPTYRLTGNEAASPRGRLDLLYLVAQGELAATDIAAALDFCLGCRACETACPAGVAFGELLVAGRATVTAAHPKPWLVRWLLCRLVPSPAGLRVAALFLRLYQASGMQKLLRASGLWRLAPALGAREALLPPLPPWRTWRRLPAVTPAVGTGKGTVALLTGCVVPVLLPQLNQATVQVLARNGYRVLVPAGQRCCGALQAHAGELEAARQLARHHLALFEAAGADWVISNAAGCGAMLKEYGELLRDDPRFAERAAAFSARVRDVSELLASAPLRGPLAPLPLRVAYDDPCHLLHGQGIAAPPRQLLRQVPALELLEVPESDWCCGSAGIYNLVHPEMAQQLLERKLRHLAALRPQVIATGNPGCIVQLRYGATRHGLAAEVLHPVEVLARAYGEAAGAPQP
ncbi:MAG: glycolate oxidase iron-sulfur subunit [Candidatus Tectimicrobiota bacterium]|nr:MAG: glycolate oxidase iron-sulfur subunit [Candidatus Tectomicrobia bacterium]